jgi:hypothetical protein
LADSLSGGLRQDLSLALENSGIFNQMFADGDILPSAVSPNTGPRWQTIKDFYDLAQRPSNTVNLDTVTPGPGAPAPVISEIRLLFKIYPNKDTNTWHMRVNVAAGLANPYTIPLQTAGLHLAFDRVGQDPNNSGSYYNFGTSGNQNWGSWWVWVLDGNSYQMENLFANPDVPTYEESLTIAPFRIASFPIIHRASTNNPPSSPWTLNGSDTAFTIPATVWQPGEIKYFAIDNRNQIVTNSSNQTVTLSEIQLAPRDTHYFSYDTAVPLPDEINEDGEPREYTAWLQHHPNQSNWGGARNPIGFAVSLYRPVESPLNTATPRPLTRADITSLGSSFPTRPENALEPDLEGGITAGVVNLQMRLPFLENENDRFVYEARPYAFRPYADNNIRAQFQRPAPMQTSSSVFWSFFPYTGTRYNVHTNFTSGFIGNSWSWGGRYHGQDNTSWPRFTPFDWPRQRSQGEPPLLSLGELQHIDLTANDDALSIGFQPGAAVGNSYHPPLLQRNLSLQQRVATAYNPNRTMRFFDISYLLNSALFDRYFFSSYPGGSLQENLPNRRFGIIDRNGFLNPRPGELAGTSSARSLLVEGSFNVNSTNPESWAAVLASTIRIPVDPDGLTQGTAFARSINQLEGADRAHLGTSEDSYSGYRRLTDAEIRRLAWEMVRQVRQRGPFLSLAQFVNRTLISADASGTGNLDPLRPPANMGLAGPLQTAINAAGINRMPGVPNQFVQAMNGLNNEFWPDYQRDFPALQASSSNNPPPHGSRLTGIPGYLTQADVLQIIAPVINARSDTFRIRAYGETTAPDGTPLARTWCEAIVQRRPDYVNPDENPAGTAVFNLSTINSAFGRKFEIIEFRWLTENEI